MHMNHEGMPVYASEKGVHCPAFFKYSFLTPSRGWQLVAVGDMTKSRTENPFSLIFKGFHDMSPTRRSGYISGTISASVGFRSGFH